MVITPLAHLHRRAHLLITVCNSQNLPPTLIVTYALSSPFIPTGMTSSTSSCTASRRASSDIVYFLQTHNKRDAEHSAAPREHIHLQDSARHPGHPGKASRTRHGKQTTPRRHSTAAHLLIRGHTHARPEPCPTGLCKHPQTRTAHEEGTPT
jgi:hypothetical protein